MKLIKNGKGTRKCKKCGIIFVVYMTGNHYSHICCECRMKLNKSKCAMMIDARQKMLTHDTRSVKNRI
jgi:hypothetical protein